MSRNSPCNHRNRTKGDAQGLRICRGNHSHFISTLKWNGDVHCVTVGTDHRAYFSPAQTQGAAVCRDSKSSKDGECYIIEVAMKLSKSGDLE